MQTWGKIKDVASYCGLRERTIRKWLTMGLCYSKMPGGCILIKFTDVDDFLNKYKHNSNEVEAMVEDLIKRIGGQKAGPGERKEHT